MSNQAYGVDYLAPDGWHHTVVMAPTGAAAKLHVTHFHPERDVRKVYALRDEAAIADAFTPPDPFSRKV